MGTFTYENQGTYTFLIYTADSDEVMDTVAVGMTTNNKLEGIISPGIQQKNMTMVCKYNITSMTALEDVLLGVINRKKLIALLESMTKSLLYAQQYLLSEEDFLLDAAHIYVDASTGQASLIAKPVIMPGGSSYQNFIKAVLNSVISDESEDCTYIVKIRNYVNRRDGFSYEGFLEVLHKLDSFENSVYTRADITPKQEKPVAEQPKVGQPLPQQPNSQQTAGNPMVSKTPTVPNIPNIPNNPNVSNTPKGMTIPQIPQAAKKEAQIPKQPKEEKEKGFGFGKLFGKKEKESNPQKKQSSPLNFAYPGKAAAESVGNPVGMAIPGRSNINVQPVSAPQPQAPAPMPVQSANVPPQQMQQPVQAQQGRPAPQVSYVEEDYGNTIMMSDDDGATVLLTGDEDALNISGAARRVYITREKNQQKMEIAKPMFKLGRSADTADFYVAGNGMVGREHAFIIREDEHVFIKDNNSKNHTYVNDEMVRAGERVELKDQDVVRLADENFLITIQ